MSKTFLTDIKTIRKRAREHIKNGAVTEGYKGILAMEEEHADDLANFLKTLDPTKVG